MCVVSGKVTIPDVRQGEDVQLRFDASAGRIDGEQDGPGHQAADEADDGYQLEVAEQEVRVHRVVLQDVRIGQLVHVDNPADQTRR